MRKRFEGITKIEDRELFDLMSSYCDALIDEATANGSLDEQYADNEYTREIGRVGCLCADYERDYMVFDNIDFSAPVGYYDDDCAELGTIKSFAI
jgi:hypothetical protein